MLVDGTKRRGSWERGKVFQHGMRGRGTGGLGLRGKKITRGGPSFPKGSQRVLMYNRGQK